MKSAFLCVGLKFNHRAQFPGHQPWSVFRGAAQFLLVAQVILPISVSLGAATVWTGPRTNFTKADFADPNLAANQDRMTPNVWITRGGSQGIYNAKTEASFVHFFSPNDTEWADGTTANYSTLSYTDWNSWAKGVHAGPPSTVGVNAVVHLKSDNIYVDIMFTSWAGGGSGGEFAYSRSTPAAANNPPSVTLTNPVNGAIFIAPANVTIQATASDSDGSVTNVQFFDGANSLGNVASSPYQVSANLAVGTHSLTAVARDNLGASTTSSPPVMVTVNTNIPPSVAITNPVNGATFVGPASVTIKASASDSDGSVTNVQFFDGANSLGNVAASPYQVNANLAIGPHTLTAVATDNRGASTTSSPPVMVIVNSNTPPLVTITNPGNGASFTAPANVLVQASATDTDGSIANVEFFNGATSLGVVTNSPYAVTVSNLAAGSYTLSAVASDNLNATATNSVTITVTNPPLVIGTPTFQNGVFSFSFMTQTGHAYTVQFNLSLDPANWKTLTNFPGDGSAAQISDSTATNSQRNYRVGAQ